MADQGDSPCLRHNIRPPASATPCRSIAFPSARPVTTAANAWASALMGFSGRGPEGRKWSVTSGALALKCEKESFCCIPRCHVSAITHAPQPLLRDAGGQAVDLRPARQLLAHGRDRRAPYQDLNYKTGASGGGFDKMRFVYPRRDTSGVRAEEVSTAVRLNRSGDRRPLRRAYPCPSTSGACPSAR